MYIKRIYIDDIEVLYKYLNDNLKELLNSYDSNHNIIKCKKLFVTDKLKRF